MLLYIGYTKLFGYRFGLSDFINSVIDSVLKYSVNFVGLSPDDLKKKKKLSSDIKIAHRNPNHGLLNTLKL